MSDDGHLVHIEQIAKEDAAGLLKAHESYGPSWKKRGGVGAYMVMIRKFDRMDIGAEKYGWDIFKAVEADPRAEGILDDIRDARRYLMLIESALREKGIVEAGNHRDNAVPRSYSDLDVKIPMPTPAGGRPRPHAARVLDKAHSLNKELGMECHHPDGACRCFRCLAMKELTAAPHIKGCKCENCHRDELRKRIDALPEKEGRIKPLWLDRPVTIKGAPSLNKTASARAVWRALHIKNQPVDEDSAEHAHLEACRREQHRKVCRGPGCDDPAHDRGETHAERTGIVQDQLRAEADERALRTGREYKEPVTTIIKDIDHPAGCDCVTCVSIRESEWERRHDEYAEKRQRKLYEDNPHPVACTCERCILGRNERAKARGCGPHCGCNECLSDFYLEQSHQGDNMRKRREQL